MIGIYCPDVPPTPGGVADHTLVLARALEALGSPPVVLARRGDAGLFAPLTCVVGLAPGDVAAEARRLGVTALLVQYVPFLFARRGVSPGLVRGLHRLHRERIRVAAFIHEAYVPFTRIPWLITGVPQRVQFAYLLRGASHVYTPLPRYADIARRYAGPRTQVKVAPVGATIAPSTLTRAAARERLGLRERQVAIGIFSPAASGFAHPWIATAAAHLAGRSDVTWVRFGFGSDRPLPGYPEGANVITLGGLTAGHAADTMRALDIAAAPYTDGLTMRRSGAMLALSHGIPLVSSQGPLFDPSLHALAFCEPGQSAFAARVAELADQPARRAEGAAKAGGYRSQASVETLAAMMVRDLAS